jgi:hypothetical protein
MKLNDRLKELTGQKVKIGAASSFVWVGVVDDDTIPKLYELDDKYKTKIQAQITEYQSKQEQAEPTIRNRVYKAKTARDAGWVVWNAKEQRNRRMSKEAIDTAKKYLAMDELELRKEIRAYRSKYAHKAFYTQKYLDEYIPFAEREIKEEYKSLPEIGDGTIFIVNGIENGEHWFIGDKGDGV